MKVYYVTATHFGAPTVRPDTPHRTDLAKFFDEGSALSHLDAVDSSWRDRKVEEREEPLSEQHESQKPALSTQCLADRKAAPGAAGATADAAATAASVGPSRKWAAPLTPKSGQ